MAEDDEQRVFERETEPAEADCGVRRSAEVLHDDDVGRIRAEHGLDVTRSRKVPGLHPLLALRNLPYAHTGFVVEPLPLLVDRA